MRSGGEPFYSNAMIHETRLLPADFAYNGWVETFEAQSISLLIIPEGEVKRVIREEFFGRSDLTPEQSALLESARVLLIMLDNASGAFAQNQPSAALQIARHADVIGETAESALDRFSSADRRRLRDLYDVLSLFRRIVCALKRMCMAGAAPLEGLDEAHGFLGSLCRGMADELDWSAKRQLLGAQRNGAGRDDIDLSLSELPSSLAGESRLGYIEALLDFRDALCAASELFELLDELSDLSERLFPAMDDKYWR